MAEIIKFRDTDGESNYIQGYTKKLGLANDSATIRILLRDGGKGIDSLFQHIWNVTQSLKYTEIDSFTTSLNVFLKQRKRDIDASIKAKAAVIVSQDKADMAHEPKKEDEFGL